jgi:5-methylcytosine-specific restriction protein A
MALQDITAAAVLQMIAEFDGLGREASLHRYGFHPAKGFFLIQDGSSYDSKAIAGVAPGISPGGLSRPPGSPTAPTPRS